MPKYRIMEIEDIKNSMYLGKRLKDMSRDELIIALYRMDRNYQILQEQTTKAHKNRVDAIMDNKPLTWRLFRG